MKDTWLKTKDLCKLLGKTPMMIYLYRSGSMKTVTPLPHYTQQNGKRHFVFYKMSEVRKWAKRNGFTITPLEQ